MASSVALDPRALDAARRLVAIARARYPVVEAWLYGSHARGEAREDSDVDVALVVDGTRENVRTAGRSLAEDTADILLDTGLVLSAVVIAAAAWRDPERFPNPSFIRNVERDGIPL